MDEKLKAKVEQVRCALKKESAEELARFDVKDGEEDGIPYHKLYLSKTTANMGYLLPKNEWGGLTPWEKLCCYKVSGNQGVDCDAALRSTVIYQLAFGCGGPSKIAQYKDGHCLLLCGSLKLRGDTMNSYATTVREYIRKLWIPEHKSEMLDSGIITKAGKGAGWAVSTKYRNMSRDNYWDAAILDNYDYFKGVLPQAAEEFFRLYHTVGNFTVWPDDCNGPRGVGPVRDYWDLTLKCIHQWYLDNESSITPKNDALLKLFGSQMVIFCDWLASFGSWDKFVRENYMQNFVYGEDGREDGANVPADGHFGPPKELWDGHFTNGVMPKKASDFNQFFNRASEWIAKRGRRIAPAVKAALSAEGPGTAAEEACP